MADRCEIQLSYAIGVADPTSIMVETFGTEKVSHDIIIEAVRQFFDLRPYGLQEMLNLLQPIYKKTAAYGHFGREEFPWEATDKVELLRDFFLNPLRFKFPSGDLYFPTLSTIVNKVIVNKMLQTRSFS